MTLIRINIFLRRSITSGKSYSPLLENIIKSISMKIFATYIGAIEYKKKILPNSF